MCTKMHYVLKFSANFFIFFFQNFCPGKLLPNLIVKYFPIAIFKNRDQDIPDVRMGAEQVRSSLFPAKSRLCWC
jgi:hypothetical protein